jgi:hypothetical protein
VSSDNPYFVAMLRVNIGKYKGAAAMNRNNAMDVVSLIFDVALDYLRNKYATLSISSISFDGWSNKRKMRYIGVTLAAFDQTTRRVEHDLIAMPPTRGKLATELLATVIEREVNRVVGGDRAVASSTTDGASLEMAASLQYSGDSLHCLGHLLQLWQNDVTSVGLDRDLKFSRLMDFCLFPVQCGVLPAGGTTGRSGGGNTATTEQTRRSPKGPGGFGS